MRAENRHILLTVDNFSAHSIDYVPTNIQLEFFEPNLTSFVQPLDAGIIRCYKAQYRKAVCMRALELDAAGERDIYKINVLEGIKMSEAAWNAVTAETIQHCWNHTKIIQPFVCQIKLLSHALTLILDLLSSSLMWILHLTPMLVPGIFCENLQARPILHFRKPKNS